MTAVDETLLARNLEALARHPAALRAIEGVEPHDGVTVARSGEPTWALPGGGAGDTVMHSRYEPRAEAARLLPEEHDPLATTIFLGAGLGYGPAEFARRAGSGNTIIWVEPDARAFRTAIGALDLTELFAHPRLRLVVGTPPRVLYELLMTETAVLMAAQIQLVPHPPTVQRDPQRMDQFRQSISDFIVHGSVQIRTGFMLARRIMANKAASLGRYLTSPGVLPLRGALAGQPLLIVAAGPSLRHNLDLIIEKAAGRVPILAVSTALRLLLGRGVAPDLTNVIDYHRISARYFEIMEADEAPPILAELGASNEALATHPGTPLFGADPLIDELFEGIAADKGNVNRASSVAAGAFHVATYLGADPIVFCGLDLSYPGGILHVPGTAIHNAVFPRTHRFFSLESWELEYYMAIRSRMYKVPSVDGGEVPTEEVLFSYLKELGAAFEAYPGTVIDASEGGARLDGCEIMKLEDVLERFVTEPPRDLRQTVHGARDAMDLASIRRRATARLEELRAEIDRLMELYEEMVPLLDEVIDKTEGGESANELAFRIQGLGERADAERRATRFVKALAQADMWAIRQREDRLIDSSEESGAGLQLQQARRDREYLRGALEASDTIYELLDAMDRSVEAIPTATVS